MGAIAELFSLTPSAAVTDGALANPDPITVHLTSLGTQGGVPVNEDTAMMHSAVWRAVHVVSNSLAQVSVQVVRREGRVRVPVDDSPVRRLLNVAPCPEVTAFEFRRTLTAHAMLWGNGYAWIEREGSRPVALWPLTPWRVSLRRDPDTMALFYELRLDNGLVDVLPFEDVLHIKALSPNGLVGWSCVRMARESIGLGMAMERYGSAFFANDARPGIVLTHPQVLSDQAREHLKESIEERRKLREKWRPMILEEGLKLDTVGIPPEDAQFIEGRKFNTTDIARWFGVPPHKIFDLERSTFSNIESQERQFVGDAVVPWARGWEQAAEMRLLPSADIGNVDIRHNLNALMRGDAAARGTFYKEMFNIGAFSPNDIRSREDLNPVEGGDRYWRPLNMAPLDEAEPQDRRMQDRRADGLRQAHRTMLADCARRVLTREVLHHKRIAGKDDFADRVREFYSKQAEVYREVFAPALMALNEALGTTTAPSLDDEQLETVIDRAALIYVNEQQSAVLAAHESGTLETALEDMESNARVETLTDDLLSFFALECEARGKPIEVV